MAQDFVNDGPLQLALREMQAAFASRLTRRGLIFAIFVLMVGGPFGTFESFNFGERAAYWAAMVAVSYFTGQGAATFFLEVLRPWIAQRWPRVIVAGLLTALPVTVVVVVINSIAYQRFATGQLLQLWLYTTLVTLAVIVALVTFSDRVKQGGAATAEAVGGNPVDPEAPQVALPLHAPEPQGQPPILERVPLPQRGRLLALSVEDHYVDIVTDKGKALVLMRLADAMKETGSIAGLQIHRSHWVAREAVVKAVRSEGKLSLELSNGLRLPVSRSYLPAVKEAGLGA